MRVRVCVCVCARVPLYEHAYEYKDEQNCLFLYLTCK
jgi:hypothetical protein